MKNDEIQKSIDFLLSLAIPKCHNIHEAEDLVQETVLAALAYTARGNRILNLEAWLRVVFNRKFYDLLRDKYNKPTITFDGGFEMSEDRDFMVDVIRREEAENIRKEVAFLSEIYRTIIVKHYFFGESVQCISAALKIPEGTVKSRLNFGRQQLKKGMKSMEHYIQNSYMPQKLIVRNSGVCGLNEVPMTLADEDNVLAQNLLILAYEKPVTITELSKAIGVSSAYVEPVVAKLVGGELMKRLIDGRVYTDFIIYQAEDYIKYMKEQEAFAAAYSHFYCQALETAINALKKTNFYSLRLERYMMISIAENGLYQRVEECREPQIFPERPNGGRWIAFGTIYPHNYVIPEEKRGQEEYAFAGQRQTMIGRYLDADDLKLYNYETSLYPYPKHEGYGYATFQEVERDMLKLFYLIVHKVDPASVDCSLKILKAFPLLAQRGFISTESGVPELLIPRLTHAQEREFLDICEKASITFAQGVKKPLFDYLGTHKKKIPSHLKSVPDQKLTMPYEPGPMMFVFEAIKRGLHPRNLGFVCPETYAVFD